MTKSNNNGSAEIDRLKKTIEANLQDRKKLERKLNDLVRPELDKLQKKRGEEDKKNKKGKSGNVGEWSEVYVFYRLMERGGIYAAGFSPQDGIQPVYDAFLPVLKIIREEFPELGVLEYYTANGENGDHAMKIYYGDFSEPLLECKLSDFREKADSLVNELKNNSAGRRTMDFPEQSDFLKSIYIQNIKSPAKETSSSFGGKSDIKLEIIQQDHMRVKAGFSIKSGIKSDPTLINSSKSNEITYLLQGCTDADMNEINAIDSKNYLLDRTRRILEKKNIEVKFFGYSNEVFQNNLFLIADREPEVVAYSTLYARAVPESGKGSNSKMPNILETLCRFNPLKIKKNVEVYYRKRMEDFLYAFACGMQSATPWDGKTKINGGYIMVTKKGDILVFYASDQDNYKSWLFRSTYFTTPDMSRHENGFAYINKKNGKYYFKLPLHVKFRG